MDQPTEDTPPKIISLFGGPIKVPDSDETPEENKGPQWSLPDDDDLKLMQTKGPIEGLIVVALHENGDLSDYYSNLTALQAIAALDVAKTMLVARNWGSMTLEVEYAEDD